MQRLLFLSCIVIVLGSSINAQPQFPKKIKLPINLVEVSGLYIASPDRLWWHNDSGDRPRLILTDQKGSIKNEIELPVKNRDWEDLTSDPHGNIYIGDFGNNLNKRQDLCIYIYNTETELVDSILFTYPDQQLFPPDPAACNFDMEAFFWHHNSLHLFTKNRLLAGNYYTKHYILPAAPGTYVAELKDSIRLNKRVVTAAAISPDGQTVALLAYYFRNILGFIPKTRTTIWLLTDFDGSNFLKGTLHKLKVRKCLVPTQFESLDFLDNQSVLIASERTPVYKQQAKRVQLKPSRAKIIKP